VDTLISVDFIGGEDVDSENSHRAETGRAAVLYHIMTGRRPFTERESSPDALLWSGMEHCPIHGGEAAG